MLDQVILTKSLYTKKIGKQFKMSFRIDDILKKDVPKVAVCNVSLNNEQSILQQTLSNNFASNKNTSDYNSAKFQPTNVYNFENFFPSVYLSSYINKEHSYPNMYSRSRLWSLYPTSLPIAIPLHYTNYSKRKGGQVRFTANQTDALEKRFNSHKYLSPEDRRILAESLKLTDRQVKTWFQNRRAKWRRCNSTMTNSADAFLDNHEDSETELEICDSSSSCKLPLPTTQA